MIEERYTKQLKEALCHAQEIAKKYHYEYVGTEHLLAGLASTEDSTVALVLRKRNIKLTDILAMIKTMRSSSLKGVKGNLEYTPKAIEVLLATEREAERLCSPQVGTEHLFQVLLRDIDGTVSVMLNSIVDRRKLFIDILDTINYTREDYKSLVKEFALASNGKEEYSPTLEMYTRDLNERAMKDELEPVIGRTSEIERLTQTLSRRMKNNPCLVGEPGVGKTVIVEGLARKIVEGSVPETMRNKRILSVDVSSIVAGTKFRGEFEERMQRIIQDIIDDGNIILFIDEIHTIIGAGSAEGSLDASNILKPYMARGEIQVIGATTITEYRKYIEKDPALERRFQPIDVKEPTVEETIQILEGIVDRYERHHQVSIAQDALAAAASLSARYVNDRYLPDKAIDLIDEAAAMLCLQQNELPDNLLQIKQDIRVLEQRQEQAIINEEFEALSELGDEIKQKDKKYKLAQKRYNSKKKRPVVTEEQIAKVLEKWTKIPVEKLTENEMQRLQKLESVLHKRVIGQEEAVTAVAKAVRRGRVGIKDPNKPIGSFLFLGPTGVGKTELSKALAEAVFGSEDAIIRVDMSEFMEQHSVSKLAGSPPGYIGYEEGGQLSEKVRRNPYSVVLFDEIEKAHPDIFNMLLQMLDDGHITDAHGRKIDFKNTIIIMTSNIGASKIVEPKKLGFTTNDSESQDYEMMKTAVIEETKKLFKPEFINRIDEMIVFHALTKENIKSIVTIMVNSVANRIKKQMNITIKVTAGAKAILADKSYDKKFGARPLKRTIQSEIEDILATEILDGNIKSGDKVVVSGLNKKIKLASKSTE